MLHAPGPWAVFGKTVSSIHHQRRYAVARVENDKFTPEANAANARLIAAAPDLLAALRGLVTALEGMAVHPSHYAQARAAIARAIGTDA